MSGKSIGHPLNSVFLGGLFYDAFSETRLYSFVNSVLSSQYVPHAKIFKTVMPSELKEGWKQFLPKYCTIKTAK